MSAYRQVASLPQLPVPAGVMTGLAFLSLAGGFITPALGTVMGSVLVFAIVWIARAEYLPALMVSQLHAVDFNLNPDVTEALREAGATVIFAGVPFNVNYVLAATVLARVTWELARRPGVFRDCRWVLAVWYVAMVPALVMSLMGKFDGNPSWTGPIRAVWMFGGLFYGYILARSWRIDGRIVSDGLLPVIVFIILCVNFGIFEHKLRFVVAPATMPIAWYVWRERRGLHRALALFAVILSIMQGMGIVVEWRGDSGREEGPGYDNFGVGGTTLTFNALCFGSALLTVLVFRGSARFRSWLAGILGLPMILGVILFSLVIAEIGPRFVRPEAPSKGPMSLEERFAHKLFGDRSVIWNASLEDAKDPPYFFKASGLPVYIMTDKGTEMAWEFGAHNSIVNTLASQRWLSGPLLLLMLVFAVRRNANGILDTRSGGVSALATCVVLTAAVGIVVNDYPLDPMGAFWFFGFAGIVSRFGMETGPAGASSLTFERERRVRLPPSK